MMTRNKKSKEEIASAVKNLRDKVMTVINQLLEALGTGKNLYLPLIY